MSGGRRVKGEYGNCEKEDKRLKRVPFEGDWEKLMLTSLSRASSVPFKKFHIIAYLFHIFPLIRSKKPGV